MCRKISTRFLLASSTRLPPLATLTTHLSLSPATTARCKDGRLQPPLPPLDNLSSCIQRRLGDHDDWGKTMPWQGSASVPLVISAPSPKLRASLGLASNATVAAPVATLDIAGTALDFAGASAASNMTTQTLRPLLVIHSGNVTPTRAYVSSGLQSWRLVVMSHPANGHALKLVCCKGPCPGQPKNSTLGSGTVDADWTPILRRVQGGRRAHSVNARSDASVTAADAAFTLLLYDTTVDPFDMEDVSSSCEEMCLCFCGAVCLEFSRFPAFYSQIRTPFL